MYIFVLHNKKQFHHLTPRKRACNTMPLKSTCCGITFNIHAFFATTEDFASNLWLWGKLFFDLHYNWFVKMAATHCNCKFSWWTHSVDKWTKILITYSVGHAYPIGFDENLIQELYWNQQGLGKCYFRNEVAQLCVHKTFSVM